MRRGIFLLVLLLAGCQRGDMALQSKTRPLGPSAFFPDGRSARPLPEDVVARETACLDAHLCEGKVGGKDATTFPFPITREIMTRGRERFDIYCAVCHGRTGDGDGMIVQRGLKHPPSYHIERLVSAPVGHYFDVMTNGFQTMYSSKDRVSVQDRWAIIAYIRALQFSRRASLKDVPPDVREKLAREGKGSQ